MPPVVVIMIKLMPESPEVDLEGIKQAARETLETEGAKNLSFEERPIAFGLKAVIAKFDMPEEKGTDTVEEKLSKIQNVSSVTIEDYRRVFG